MQPYSITRGRDEETALILSGPARLAVEKGKLRVETGSGIRGNRQTLEFAPPLRLARVIFIGRGGTWSDHALRMLTENGAALYQMSQSGEVGYQVLPPDGAIKPALLRLQANLRDLPEGLDLARYLIAEKVLGQQDTLSWLRKQARLPGSARTATLAAFLAALETAKTLDDIRIAEALAADRYFTEWSSLPLSFAKTPRGCVEVPEHWKRWDGRKSLRTGARRDATDPLNALLNFGYAIAAAETTIACRAASLVPSLGIIHADQEGRENFVYDLVEPLRPQVDRYVLGLVTQRTFRLREDFFLLPEGVCRIGIEFAEEIGRAVSAFARPGAMAIAAEVRGRMLRHLEASKKGQASVRQPRREPELAAAEPSGAVCGRCGGPAKKGRLFCDPCFPLWRSERRTEANRQQWEEWRTQGVDPTHGGEAAKRRGGTIARSNALKPRKAKVAR